ncbi:MAG TPA: prolyl oligopeptidase family serine peptidase [Polyangiales bacterium]|nr:prolyl oligopeptidase family serine peptidase [Polyangiales bacterium]
MANDPRRTGLPEELVRLNAELRKGAVSELVAGIEVDDPYRALESDTPETRRWIDAQTERTEGELAKHRDPAMEQRLRELLSIGTIGDVAAAGERVFFTLREGERERPALFVIDAAQPAPPTKPLIDPAEYGERASLDYVFPSNDGHYVAFGISDNGDERATLRVYDVEAKKTLRDKLAHTKWSTVSWLPDDSGFFYTRYPLEGEPDYDAKAPDTYWCNVMFHRVGQDPISDSLVFRGKEPTDFPAALVDETGRYVVIENFRSWTASDVWLWDRGKKPNPVTMEPGKQALTAVVVGEDKLTTGNVRDGFLYLLTNVDAPRKRIARVPVAQPGDRAKWQTIVPETSATIEDAAFSTRGVALQLIDDVHSELGVTATDGSAALRAQLPTRGSLDSLSISPRGSRAAFVFSSFAYPPALFSYDFTTHTLTRLYQVANSLDENAFEQQRVQARSKDGTPVDISFVHEKGLVKNGDTPVLLEGYGGFDVALLPELKRSGLYFVERGGIYAVANLRGGGEHGEAFHRDGMLKNKQHVFEDFEAAIAWFTSSGYSKPSRIAITGGSNGGLLMGAMITRVPQSFAAATSYVGLYDMLRYPLFPPAALWISEYGDPKDPEMAAYLLAYSPYHRVLDGTAYPSVLLETADHDTRVFYGHSLKFAARLQDANAGPHPIYFYMERSMGHGHGTGLADLARREARRYAFLSAALGL